jgi:hypothetical protein
MQRYSGSQMFPVTYAGPQKPGLDQVNILLPAKLAGSGAVSITCWEYQFFIASSSGCLTRTVATQLDPSPPPDACRRDVGIALADLMA